jgi:hypothetical protein
MHTVNCANIEIKLSYLQNYQLFEVQSSKKKNYDVHGW